MKANLKINQEDLKVLYLQTKSAYKNISFTDWCKECKKSYISYFNNKEIFIYTKYTYSEFVNAQIIALQLI